MHSSATSVSRTGGAAVVTAGSYRHTETNVFLCFFVARPGTTFSAHQDDWHRDLPGNSFLVRLSSFDIEERQEPGWVRLALIGELDLGTVPGLEERLRRLAAAKQPVRVDLSRLDFIDSSGIRLLIQTLRYSRRDGWNVEVDMDMAEPVRQVLRLANVESLIVAQGRADG